jgi:predicted outer membrane protein
MRRKTTAVALAGMLLAVPAAALAQQADDPPSPLRAALRAPVGGHLTVEAQMRAEARERRQEDLVRRAAALHRRVDEARGKQPDATAERRRLSDQPPAEVVERMRELRDDLRDAREPQFTASPTMEAIAQCESGGDPTTNTGNGFYGKYQFTLETWQGVGGSGLPSEASEAEQDMRAAMLYEQAGASPWPVCGR